MTTADVLGYVGGALVTFGMLPQVIRVYRLKSAREISLLFTVLFIAGAVFWLSYGIAFRLAPVMVSNLFSLALILALFVAKLKYGR